MEVIYTMEKTKGEILAEELTWEFPNIAKEAPEQREAAEAFSAGYKAFWIKVRQSGSA